MEQRTETESTEEVVFDKIITDDAQLDELVQLLRRLKLQEYKRVRVVVRVGHK